MQSARPEQWEPWPAARAEPPAKSRAAQPRLVPVVAADSGPTATRPPESREEYSPAISSARSRKIPQARLASSRQTCRIDFRDRVALGWPAFVLSTTARLAERKPPSRIRSMEPGPAPLPAGNTRKARCGDKDFARSVQGCARR